MVEEVVVKVIHTKELLHLKHYSWAGKIRDSLHLYREWERSCSRDSVTKELQLCNAEYTLVGIDDQP